MAYGSLNFLANVDQNVTLTFRYFNTIVHQNQYNSPLQVSKPQFPTFLLVYQTIFDESMSYLRPQSKAVSLSMSVSLSVKSKSFALSFILSGFEDLGTTGTPCCTAQRNRTWRGTKSVFQVLKNVPEIDVKMLCVCVFTCAGVRSHSFATSMTTGSVSSSPCPKEENAWKHTPYSLHTFLSSVWHSFG